MTLVMGILNVTPDSFSDGGDFYNSQSAISHARRLAEEGADILDIGGESTRPNAQPVTAQEEWTRVEPVLKELVPLVQCPISIDTYKASTAEAALKAGARIVNDVWGLQREPEIARVAAHHGAPVVVMRNRERVDPSLDIVDEMLAFFERSLAIARREVSRRFGVPTAAAETGGEDPQRAIVRHGLARTSAACAEALAAGVGIVPGQQGAA